MKMESFSENALAALELVLNGFDGALVIDERGRVIVYTEHYEKVAKIPREEVMGRFVTDVWPDSRMLEVLSTGKPVYVDVWETGDESVFVSRYPIVSEGRIIGVVAVCVFRYLDEAKRFAGHIRSISRELQFYKEQFKEMTGARYSFDAIVGKSPAILLAKKNAMNAAKAPVPVLIAGETGTGKELFAHAIHQESSRRDKPFIRINCASIPDNLVESELFGYEEGAFSGARSGGKPGKFELANGGTIFLDEVNALPLLVQAKLLRVLQEGEIDRVGSTSLTRVDVRVISATNTDLKTMVNAKLFREDLYYRINAFPLNIPPLRMRMEDLPVLCEHFIDASVYELGISPAVMDARVLDLFSRYNWPGNLRELKNVVQRACLLADGQTIKRRHLPPDFAIKSDPEVQADAEDLDTFIRNAEKKHIISVLQSVRWNRNKAGEILGINRTLLYRKMKKYNLLND